MAPHNERGKEGEEEARKYLLSNGYNIYESNWRFHHFELDIIAEKDGMLVVVEVKTRSSESLLTPEEIVDKRKIRRTVEAADAYIRFKNINLPVRFDIIGIFVQPNGTTSIDHIEDAFLAPLN